MGKHTCSDLLSIMQKRHLTLHVLSLMVLSSQRMFIRGSYVRSLPQYIVTQQSSSKNHSKILQRSSRLPATLISLSFCPNFSQSKNRILAATARPGAETGRHRFMVGWGSRLVSRNEITAGIEQKHSFRRTPTFLCCDWRQLTWLVMLKNNNLPGPLPGSWL